MALSTNTELVAAVATWLNRTDLTSVIPDFVKLAEGDINTQVNLRTMEVDETLSLTATNRRVALPSGFLQPIDLWLVEDGERVDLQGVLASDLDITDTSGQPTQWAVDGTYIAFNCPADATYTFTLRCVEALSIATTSTNWLLSNLPNTYLAGALAYGFAYIMDDGRAGQWKGVFDEYLVKARMQAGRSRSTAPLKVDAALMGASCGPSNINTGL